MSENKDYPKAQYSEFTDDGKLNGKGGQWVFRAETVSEVKSLRDMVKGESVAPALREPGVASGRNVGKNAHILEKYPDEDFGDMEKLKLTSPCDHCKGDMAWNHKTGKIFCSEYCWTK